MAALLVGAVAGDARAQSSWPSAGLDLKNSRYSAGEKKISPQSVGRLRRKWSVDTTGDVTANPAVDGNYLYFPDSAGYLYKVRRDTGAIVWAVLCHDLGGDLEWRRHRGRRFERRTRGRLRAS
jgi:polyvinyl alcohol dehydrogenase (cytochrome)